MSLIHRISRHLKGFMVCFNELMSLYIVLMKNVGLRYKVNKGVMTC